MATSADLSCELLYDSGLVAGGVAIDSGKLDVRRYTQLIIAVNNADAGVRSLNWSAYLPTGTSSVAAGSLGSVAGGNIWQLTAWGGGWVSGLGTFAGLPGHVGLQIAAGGATNARMVIWGR